MTAQARWQRRRRFARSAVGIPVEQLEEAFAEGFVTTHSTMPEFVLDAGQNRDLIAYLASIQEE